MNIYLMWALTVGSYVVFGLILHRLPYRRQRGIDFSDPSVLLEHWILQAAALETKEALHAHIIKHANELITEIEGNGQYDTWAASMRNLLQIFEAFHAVSPDVDLQLERMTAKFLSGRGTLPPAPVPEHIVRAVKPSGPPNRRIREGKQPLRWEGY